MTILGKMGQFNTVIVVTKKIQKWNSETVFAEKILMCLLFLFPILSLSVQHWLTSIFTILAVLSLYFAWQGKITLRKEEKILLLIFGLYSISRCYSYAGIYDIFTYRDPLHCEQFFCHIYDPHVQWVFNSQHNCFIINPHRNAPVLVNK